MSVFDLSLNLKEAGQVTCDGLSVFNLENTCTMPRFLSAFQAGLIDTLPSSTSVRWVNATFTAHPNPDPTVKMPEEIKKEKKKAGIESEQMENNWRKTVLVKQSLKVHFKCTFFFS